MPSWFGGFRMDNYNRKTLFWGLGYGLFLLAACILQRIFFGMDRVSKAFFFAIALISTLISALRWYFAFDKKFKSGSSYFDSRIPRLTDDPQINSLVINVYKWFVILPVIGVLTL